MVTLTVKHCKGEEGETVYPATKVVVRLNGPKKERGLYVYSSDNSCTFLSFRPGGGTVYVENGQGRTVSRYDLNEEE